MVKQKMNISFYMVIIINVDFCLAINKYISQIRQFSLTVLVPCSQGQIIND